MTTPATPDQLREVATWLNNAADHLTKARRNLNEMLPGFKTSTPGAAPTPNGYPPIEYDDNGKPLATITLTIVEQLAGRPDPARNALDRLTKLTSSIGPDAKEILSICRTWGMDPARLEFDLETETEYCSNHLRIDLFEVRYRGPLCRWCYDIRSEYGYTPGVELMELRHRTGKRLTETIYRAHHPAQLRTGPNHPKKKKARK